MSQGIDVPGELALMDDGSGVGKATPLPLSTIDTPGTKSERKPLTA